MSLADPRPRRIIAGPALPLPHLAPVTVLEAQQHHRFQRVLLATPRTRPEARPERCLAEWPLRPQQPPAEPARPQPRGAEPPPREPQVASARQAPAPATPPSPASTGQARPRRPATRAVAPRPALETPELPPRRDLLADPLAWKHAGLARPAPEDWDVDLAQRIAALCQRASPSLQSWSVTVPLDAAVLPDTELHMALSPQRLGLRFQTQSPYSMALVRRHQHRLVALLEGALPAAREIDLELS